MDGHEEFRELCAVSVAGDLTCEEQARLGEHLQTCPSCRKTFDQYRATIVGVLPQLALREVPSAWSEESSWDPEDAENALFERLKLEEHFELPPRPFRGRSAVAERYSGLVPAASRWKEIGMLYAAGIFLFLALTIASYRLGIQQGTRDATASMLSGNGPYRPLPDIERERLAAELHARDKTIARLKDEAASLGSKGGPDRVDPRGSRTSRDAQMPSASERSVSSDPRFPRLREQLSETSRTRSDDAARSDALEAKAGELAKQLRDRDERLASQRSSLADADRLVRDRDKMIADQQDLLAHDRDIRELIGSRNLYIAEVYDVAKTGQDRKPFGRVFYTKGKSLIFYAYNLDQQASADAAVSFQVWGREAADAGRPVSLGVFFEDSVANKRWLLKSENVQSLEQLDAVFVTVEPNGGSPKPSGKPLLFASLKAKPNHP